MNLFSSFKDAAHHASQCVIETSCSSNDGAETLGYVKCGELSCQKESLQTRLDRFKILSIAQFQEVGGGKSVASGTKKSKKKKSKNAGSDADTLESSSSSSPTADGSSRRVKYHDTKFAAAVSDSILFPEGGGQPPDHGVLKFVPTDDGSGDSSQNVVFDVTNAQNVNYVCILLCEFPLENDSGVSMAKAEQILMDTCTNITNEKSERMPSTTYSVIQEINWDRRFDLMTQHSAQHLISAVAQNSYAFATNSFSLSQGTLTSYIDFIIPDTDKKYVDKFKSIETIANDCIRQNLSMTPTWLDPNDPQFQTKFRSRLLPDNLQGAIRLVEIAASTNIRNNKCASGNGAELIDCNTCCGTHVPSLGLLQMIQFFKMEKVKSGIIRVYFAAGKRLKSIMDDNYQRSSQITNILRCPEVEHVTRLQAIMDEKRLKELQIQSLFEELCNCKSNDIINGMRNRNDVDGVKRVEVIDLGPNIDRNYITMLSTATMERLLHVQQQEENDSALNSIKDTKVLLLFVSASTSKVNNEDQEGAFFLVGHVDWVSKSGKKIAEILGGRGGGNQGKFQGKATKLSTANLDQAEKVLINFAADDEGIKADVGK